MNNQLASHGDDEMWLLQSAQFANVISQKNTKMINENGHVRIHHPLSRDRKITVAIQIDLLLGKKGAFKMPRGLILLAGGT